jgi:hypothetical protein
MCGSQVLPGLISEFEHLDIAALVAPRALFVESGRDDLIFPFPAARETVMSLQQVYAHLGQPEAVGLHRHDGGHEWDGAGVPAFLEQWL